MKVLNYGIKTEFPDRYNLEKSVKGQSFDTKADSRRHKRKFVKKIKKIYKKQPDT